MKCHGCATYQAVASQVQRHLSDRLCVDLLLTAVAEARDGRCRAVPYVRLTHRAV